MKLTVIKDFYQHPETNKISVTKGQILNVLKVYKHRYQASFIGEDGNTRRVWIGKEYCEIIKCKKELKINRL